MVFRGPGFSGGNRVSTPVGLVDVAPTLLDAAGITVPDPMEGESILPFVGDGPEPDRDAFIQTSEAQVGRALRTDRWKYAVYAPEADSQATPQPEEYVERYLYDLAADPYEQTNLVGREEYREVADDLRRRLRERIEAVEGEPAAIRRAAFHA
jgi:arylsulfatase A-like enzyme